MVIVMRAILWLVSLTGGRCNFGNSVVGFTQLVVVVMRAILVGFTHWWSL